MSNLSGMKKPLPYVAPYGHLPAGEGSLSNEDLFSLLAGLEPGWYTTASLWPRYLVWAENENRPPVKRISLGMNLRRIAGDVKKNKAPEGGNLYWFDHKHVSGSLSANRVG